MKRTHRTIACVLVGVAPLTWSQAQVFEVSRSTIDGGGAVHSAGGQFVFSGTIGQPDSGVMTGQGFELTGGFWFSASPGDCDGDGLLSLVDFSGFGDCLTGPHTSAVLDCRCFDGNGDGRVDMADLAVIQNLRGM